MLLVFVSLRCDPQRFHFSKISLEDMLRKAESRIRFKLEANAQSTNFARVVLWDAPNEKTNYPTPESSTPDLYVTFTSNI